MSDAEEPGISLGFRNKLSAFSFQAPGPSTPRRSPRKSSAREQTVSSRGSVSRTRTPLSPSKRGFAPPEKYSHLHVLQDYLAPVLDIVFCGINPGQKSAEIGHHFGGPTNHFWPCLYESGLTTERLQPTQDYTLPDRFSIGMTNLVERPTAEQNELSRAEQIASVPSFLSKIAQYKPRIVCFVGLGIAQIVKSQVLPKSSKERKAEVAVGYGLQSFKMCHSGAGTLLLPLSDIACLTKKDGEEKSETLFFAVASTSGRVVQYQKTHKVEQFKELKILLERVKLGEIDTRGLQGIPRSIYTPPDQS